MKLAASEGGATRLPGVRRAIAAGLTSARSDEPALYDLAPTRPALPDRFAVAFRLAHVEAVR